MTTTEAMLDTTVERLEGNKVKLTVALTAEEVDGYVGGAYHEAAANVKVPGFRSGKAPRPVIDNYVGRPVILSRALEDLVEGSYPLALDAEALRPMAAPDTGELEQLDEGKPYTFEVEVELRPELTLTSAKGIKATVPPSKATDEEVDAQIDYLRDRFASLEPVDDRGIEADDFALISFTGSIDGEPYEDNVVDRYLYEMGNGSMPPEFDAGLIGAKPGDELHVEFPVPDTSANPQFVGKTAGFDITVHEIKAKKLPEADDEFASSVGGFETIAELRDDIRARMDENKSTAHVRLVEREARGELIKRLKGDVPDVLVSEKTEAMTRDFFEAIAERGITLDDYVEATGVQPEQIRADLAEEARFAVSDELALEALFRAAELELSDEDLDAELARMAETEDGDGDVATLRDRLTRTGVMPLVIEHIERRLAVRWLMENVEVIESDEAPVSATGPGEDCPLDQSAAEE